MAEHRALHDGSDNPPEIHEDKIQAFEDLRNLLLGKEKEQIAGLRERIEDRTVRTQDLSTIVVEAIELRRERGGKHVLNKALSPSVEGALRESVRKDPKVLADALFPVMGPAIRRSITESIRSMLESLNQAIDHSASMSGIRWRIESMRTGKPFAEIVLLRTLLYRVEQVFLIHNTTSLMLAHCAAPQVATQDPTLVSGMLSAIQSFVRDSFKASKEDCIDCLQVGDLEVWVEAGSQAMLAAVIRGHAPASYRTTLKKTLEGLHREFGSALEQFDGDSSALEAADQQLALCLETHYHAGESTKKKSRLPWMGVLFLAAIGTWTGFVVQNHLRWNRFVETLEAQPGILVTSLAKTGGRHLVKGLRDPLALDPKVLLKDARIAPDKVVFQWTPFYALDDESVQRRATQLLRPPVGVTLSAHDGVLSVAGEASPDWTRSLRDSTALVPGVTVVDTSKLAEPNRAEVDHLEAAINATAFIFPPGRAQVAPGEEVKFLDAAAKIKSLVAKAKLGGQAPTIEIVGHTDNGGSEMVNISLSRRRTRYVMRKLIEQGVDHSCLRPRGPGSSEFGQDHDTDEASQGNRSVTLKVVLPD